MITLRCPKCGQHVADSAIDVGQCPGCGYDGPLVLPAAGVKWAWLAATVAAIGGGAGLGVYLLGPPAPRSHPARGPAVAAVTPPPAAVVPRPAPPRPAAPEPAPAPRQFVPALPKAEAPAVAPMPVALLPRKPAPPRVGPTEWINAREVREKHLDNPHGVVLVADMNRDDRLTLTGRARVLRLGTVGGRATLDASGLEADEVVITGDLSQNAVVKVNTPAGKVTVGGHVVGGAKLAVNAPGGELVIAGSGKLDDGAEVTATASRVHLDGLMTGGAKLTVTVTAGGSLKFGVLAGGAVVVYRRAAPTDPEPTVEVGELRGGAKVRQER